MGESITGVQYWENVKSALRNAVDEGAYTSWIEPLYLEQYTQNTAVIAAPSRFISDRVESDFGDKIKKLWRDLDEGLENLKFAVRRDQAKPGTVRKISAASPFRLDGGKLASPKFGSAKLASAKGAEPGKTVPAQPAPVNDRLSRIRSIALDPSYTFENFVVGKPNQFAHASALSAAESKSPVYKPLFLYGETGLGKSHLLHSIAWKRRTLFPEEQIMFVSADTFLVEFIGAMRQRDTLSFKDLFRNVDVLIIDDIHQILDKKTSTQEEFFHTFDALSEQSRHIILSADRSPLALEALDERLRSRLAWGLQADIGATDYSLRLNILNAKIEAARQTAPGLQVDMKVLDFLAHRLVTNVRVLEGALTSLIAYSTMMGQAITIELAQQRLAQLIKISDRKISIEEIQRQVAAHYKIGLGDMTSTSRARSVARPRQVAMYLSKQLTTRTLGDIASRFRKDHTTVMHAVKRVDELRQVDATFDDDVEALRRHLEGSSGAESLNGI